jgi:RNA polymerase sigma factor (sigma-70 family)
VGGVLEDAGSLVRVAGEIRRFIVDIDPDPARDILALYYVEQYSVGEIASILDLTDSTVKKRLQRARGTLRVRLQESESVYA